MTFLDRLRRVPLTVRAPMMVAALMIVISLIISERVLTRLHEMQEQQLTNVVGTYFDGLSTALIPAVLRQDIWETFDVLDRTRVLFRSITPLEAIVTGRDGSVLASSDPHEVPVLSQLPARFAGRSRDGGISIDWNERRGFGARPLIYQGKPIGALYASFDIGHLVAERRQVLTTLLATNAALAAIFATVGYMLARRMVEPIATLTKHMRSGATGTPQRIELKKFPAGSGEITELFNGFNDLVHAQRERTALTHRLAEEEKLASLGRLASSMAHEINNPLGGLFNTIDTLRRHGANDGVRETSLSLLSRGLSGIREVVQAALATYRPDQNGRGLVLSDLEDVRLLAGPAITGRNQVLDWQSTHAGVKVTSLPGATVRQALLNLVLNASAAAGDGGKISVETTLDEAGYLIIAVSDSGPGLGDAAADVLTSQAPWPAAQAAGGLGLWMVRRLVDDVGGQVDVCGGDTNKTVITLRLPFSACKGGAADAA